MELPIPTKIAALVAAAVCTAVSLTGCSGNAPSITDQTDEAQAARGFEIPELVETGASFQLPCFLNAATHCMTVDVLNVDTDAQCDAAHAGKLRFPDGRIVALELRTSMPSGADKGFNNPFVAPAWRVTAPELRPAPTKPLQCEGKDTYTPLTGHYPGESNTGTVYLSVPANADVVHFQINQDLTVRFDVSQ